MLTPLRDFFEAIFFAFFAFPGIATNPAEIVQVLIPAALLAIVTGTVQ